MNDVVQDKPHLFRKGASGNPAGRPKGSKNAISLVKVQVEGELRAQMKGSMPEIMAKILEMAMKGDKEMLKLVYKSWVSSTKAQDDDAPKEKIQIVIGKLDQTPAINGTTFKQSNSEE